MIKIEEREVLIDMAYLIFQSENMMIIDLYTTTKYPQLGAYSSHIINLCADEHSLHKGVDPGPTQVEFDLPEDWTVHPKLYPPYNVCIYCVSKRARSLDNVKLIWEKSEPSERTP